MKYKDESFKGHNFNPFNKIRQLKSMMEKEIMEGKCMRPISKSTERVKLIKILKDELRKKTFDLAKSLES